MLQGIKSTGAVVAPNVFGRDLAHMMGKEPEPNFHDKETLLSLENRRVFENLLDWDALPEPNFNDAIKETYEIAVAYIGGNYRSLMKYIPLELCIRLHYASTV